MINWLKRLFTKKPTITDHIDKWLNLNQRYKKVVKFSMLKYEKLGWNKKIKGKYLTNDPVLFDIYLDHLGKVKCITMHWGNPYNEYFPSPKTTKRVFNSKKVFDKSVDHTQFPSLHFNYISSLYPRITYKVWAETKHSYQDKKYYDVDSGKEIIEEDKLIEETLIYRKKQ